MIKENENFVNLMLSTLTNPVDFYEWMSDLKKLSGRKGRDLFHPVRVVLTGQETGPELKKIVDFLGYDGLKKRISCNLELR
jgi:glutamyl/glutaminyl-tRNA synthetase